MTCDKWGIVIPEAATNLVSNPSIETATTGYTAVGGSIAQSSAKQKRGIYSLAVTPTSGTGDGVYYGTVTLADATAYTFSVDVWATAAVPLTIYFANTSGTQQGTPTTFTGTGDWQRVSATYTASGAAARRLYIVKNNSASTAVFYVDGLQVEAKTYATSYLDGSLGYGYSWASAVGGAPSTPHASPSTRTGQARSGGREYMLESDYGLTVRYWSGIGMPPIRNLVQEQALIPGAHYSGYHIDPRPVTLLIAAAGSASLDALHSLRATLIDALKPNLTTPVQPLILKYYGEDSANPLELSAYYDGGLDFQQPEIYKYDQIPLRLIAYDPFFYREGTAGAVLSNTQNVTTNRIAARIAGAWSGLDSGTNGAVTGIAYDSNSGAYYVTGDFTTVGSGPTTVNYVAKWNGSAWSVLTTDLNDTANCVVVDAAGGVYVGGQFTAPGEKLIYWNGSAWSNVYAGVGFSAPDQVYALAIGPDGSLYAGGDFASIDGTTVNNIAKWNGSAWSALGGTPGVTGAVLALAFGADGTLYAGGNFDNAGGVAAADDIAAWDGSTWAAVGSLGNSVNALAVDSGGQLYATGTFTTANSGATTVNYIARWNGGNWEPLSSGLSNIGYALAYVQASGLLYVGGEFATAGGVTVPKFATWNGSTFAPADITLPGTVQINTLFAPNSTDLFVGGSFNGTATASGATTVTNTGSQDAYPVIKIKRTGGTTCNLVSLRNEITGKTIWFNYSLQAGEELTLDLRLGQRAVTSSYIGQAWKAILRNSDFADWTLAPGANPVTLYATTTGSPTVTAAMMWRETHWGADN